jgi:hypothetical protein
MDERVELKIDVFDQKGQVARVLRSLTIRELIEEILLEFKEFEFLDSHAPWNYDLVTREENTPLDPAQTVAEHHLSRGTELALVEKLSLPQEGARPMPGNAYLLYIRKSETDSNRVFKLNWQPAIIGRPDTLQPQNNLLAVNLEPFPTGLRVSRRHAKIYAEDGRYYLESLSSNATLVNDDPQPLAGARELREGDTIYLERSGITLKFITRPAEEAGSVESGRSIAD